MRTALYRSVVIDQAFQ